MTLIFIASENSRQIFDALCWFFTEHISHLRRRQKIEQSINQRSFKSSLPGAINHQERNKSKDQTFRVIVICCSIRLKLGSNYESRHFRVDWFIATAS